MGDDMASPQDILAALAKVEESLYGRLHADISALRLEVNGRFDAIEVRLDRLETEYQMIVAGLRRVEEALAEDRTERARLRAAVAELKTKLSQLEARVRDLEASLAEE